MKKLVLVIATVAVVAVTAAAGALASGGPTVVAEGFLCVTQDGNGDAVYTTNSVLILYSSGKAVLQCSAYGAPAPSLIHWNYGNTGYSCGMLQFGSTLQWDDKVGRNGNAQLTCTTNVTDGPTSASSSAGTG